MKPVPEVFELDSSQINEEEVTVAALNQDVDFIHDSEDSGRYSPEDNKNDFQYEVLSTEQVNQLNNFSFLSKIVFLTFFSDCGSHEKGCR